MNTQEIGNLLGLMALHDKRQTGPGDIMAWEEVLPAGMQFDDARAALRHHRKTSTEWVMPSHIISGVRQIERERLQRAGTPPIPGDLTQAQEREWQLNWASYVRAGADKDSAAAMASADMNLPPELPTRERRAELNSFITASARNFTERQS